MSNKTTEARLEIIFRKIFEDSQLVISETMTAQDVEKWTSLTHLSMIDAVEREFNIKFKLKEILKLKNVGDLIQLVEAKLATE